MLTDAEISVAIADLDPEAKSPVVPSGFDSGFDRLYLETRHFFEEVSAKEKQRQADRTRRRTRLREWALWIAAGAVVAAVVWGLQ